MKFMLLQDYGGVEADVPPMSEWKPEEIEAHISFQKDLNAELEQRLGDGHRLHAARAHLMERAGELDQAVAEYRLAASRTSSLPEQRYLTKQAARLNRRLG